MYIWMQLYLTLSRMNALKNLFSRSLFNYIIINWSGSAWRGCIQIANFLSSMCTIFTVLYNYSWTKGTVWVNRINTINTYESKETTDCIINDSKYSELKINVSRKKVYMWCFFLIPLHNTINNNFSP